MKLRKITTTIGIMLLVICLLSVTAMASSDTLKRGKKGSKVEELQNLLIKQGVFNYSEVTGYYGKITEDAVKAFQNKTGLKADGVVGEMTWSKLNASPTVSDTADAGKNADTSQDESETFTGKVSKGMEGAQVEKIQKRLQELGIYDYTRITGYYGSITKDAVKDFQKAYGLKPDGVVGSKTMEKLFSTYKETSLIPGMKSDDVGKIQKRLKELGYYSYDIDNEYGSKTREAVVYFQSAHDLKADGVAGTQTKDILFSNSAKNEQDARRDPAENNNSNPPEQPAPPQSSDGKSKAQQAIDIAKTKIGCKYVYAAEGPDTFDCSGLTTYVYKKLGVSLPRTAYLQGYNQYGIKITDPDSLKPGDLVFFNTNKSDGDLSDHAGIYIGNGDFIHANSGKAMSIVISNLKTSAFYKAAFS
jgi:peptidoglycan hydrolase-like protein with peptidoglycan-binding domain